VKEVEEVGEVTGKNNRKPQDRRQGFGNRAMPLRGGNWELGDG